MFNESLERFVRAQEHFYSVALSEIRAGEKRSHWMWFIFPQLRGLGFSPMSYTYGIMGIEEARAYMEHPLLSARLIEISDALLGLDCRDAVAIFDTVDAVKLRSCMTLFSLVSDEGSVFHRVLDEFYCGKRDEKTLVLAGMGG